MLEKYNLKATYRPIKKIRKSFSQPRTAENSLQHSVSIASSSCGQIYIGTMRSTADKNNPKKLSVAEHSLCHKDNKIQFKDRKILSIISDYYIHLHRGY